MEQKPICIIVGAGNFDRFYMEIDRKITFVIAADGGYEHLKRVGVKPDLWVGDGDSLSDEAKTYLKEQDIERIDLPVMKDETDMLYAVNCALQMGCQSFHLYGGMGGRIDHTLANITVLSYLADLGKECFLYDGMTLLTAIKNKAITFPDGAEGAISIFSLAEESRGVTLRGLKYELENANLKSSSSLGVSNEFVGDESLVSVEDGKLLIVLT